MIRTAPYLLTAVVGAAMPWSTTIVHAQSFSCVGNRNLTIVEELICRNPRLGDLDGHLGVAFDDALKVVPDKAALREQQRQWLRTKRDKCTESDCLWRAYQTRTQELIIESRKYLPVRPIQADRKSVV
jgi:uncharacterized protein